MRVLADESQKKRLLRVGLVLTAVFVTECSPAKKKKEDPPFVQAASTADADRVNAALVDAKKDGNSQLAKELQDALNAANAEITIKKTDNAAVILVNAGPRDDGFIIKALSLEAELREKGDKALEEKIAEETRQRIAADQNLQLQIDKINDRIDGLDREIDDLNVRINGQQTLITGVETSLRGELERQKAEYLTQKEEFEKTLSDVGQRQTLAEQKITEVKDEATRAALEAEHNFAVGIKTLAEENQRMIGKLQGDVDFIYGRIEGLEQKDIEFAREQGLLKDRVGQLELDLDALDKRLTAGLDEVKAKLTEIDTLKSEFTTFKTATESDLQAVRGRLDTLESFKSQTEEFKAQVLADLAGNAEFRKSAENRLLALEMYNKIQKYCAGVGVSLTAIGKKVVNLSSLNSSIYGGSSDAAYGFGNLFGKYHRFKKSEEFFDRYHFHNFLLNKAQNQIAIIQGSCLAMLAFPGRPAENGPYPKVGIPEAAVEGQSAESLKGAEWNLYSEAEVKKYFRVILTSDQATMTPILSQVLAAYAQIFVKGTPLPPTDWDRHMLGLANLTGNGMQILSALVSNLEGRISLAQRDTYLPNKSGLCLYGNGGASFDDEAGMRYSGEEDGSVNGTDVHFHLPQSHYYYHDEGQNKLYMSYYEYRIGMGPSADAVIRGFDDQSKYASLTSAVDLLANAAAFNDFAQFPTTLERNVTYSRNLTLRDLDASCSAHSFGHHSYTDRIKVRGRIPMSNDSGCWDARVNDSATVCDQILFNPLGSDTGGVLDYRYTPYVGSNFISNSNEKVQTTAFNSQNYPTGSNNGQADIIWVVEPYLEREAAQWQNDPALFCVDQARVPEEAVTNTYTTWGTALKNTFIDYAHDFPGPNTTKIYRDKVPGKNAIFIIRRCRTCSEFGYNQPLFVDGTAISTKLTFNAELLLDKGVAPYKRCAMGTSTCDDICTTRNTESKVVQEGVDADGLPILKTVSARSFSAGVTYFEGAPHIRPGSIFSGTPFNYNYSSMLNADRCHCK